MGRKGSKFGAARVEAIPGPLGGQQIAGAFKASGPNQPINLGNGTSVEIEGVVVIAHPDNTGLVYMAGPNFDILADPPNGGALAGRDKVSLAIDNLNKVNVFVALADDIVGYVAIARERSIEP